MLNVKNMLKYWNMVLESQTEHLMKITNKGEIEIIDLVINADIEDIQLTLGLIEEAERQIEKYSKM